MDKTIEQLKAKAGQVRRDIIEMMWQAGSAHIGGSLSVADILTVLYFRVMRVDPKNPAWEDRDRLVLSKGHSAAALYAVLAKREFFSRELLFDSFIQVGGILQEHPDMRKVPGIDMSAGSLGQGLSVGAGIAWGLRKKKQDSRVFVVIGDGEVQEGQIWEAAMAAGHLRLNNLIAIIDYNGLQVNGPIKELMDIEPIASKWKSFGWETKEIDGHDISQVIKALESKPNRMPRIIIAHTIKGKGVSFMENDYSFHAGSLTPEQYKSALSGLSGQ